MNTYEKVENITRPLIKGEIFLVPCVYSEKYENYELTEQELWMDLDHFPRSVLKHNITPVINHPHSDKENGQNEIHYHADYRFMHTQDPNNPVEIKNTHYHFVSDARPVKHDNIKIKYFPLPVINENPSFITPVKFIKKSKLKHKCIHKGKCPHRGYDLSQSKSIDGVITCPLHGLKFNSETKQIINR